METVLSSIGNQAFKDCRMLANDEGFVIVLGTIYDYRGFNTKITIPDGVTSIGENAFWTCLRLKSATIPDSVTSIGDLAFRFCKKITIRASANSYAQKFAAKEGIAFEVI